MDVLAAALKPLGFACRRMTFRGEGTRIENLYARMRHGRPNLCFAGHTDVVPVGDRASLDARSVRRRGRATACCAAAAPST